MTMHVVVAGWLLGPPSGANRRLLALLEHTAARLRADERITVLHGVAFTPPPLPNVAWRAIAIPPAPTLRRAFAEWRRLRAPLRELGATVYDHGFLPLPRVPVPTCLVVHDLRAVDGFTHWPRAIARRVLRAACERAAVVTAPSEWTAARLRTLAPRATIHVVPNGVTLPASTSVPTPPPFAAPAAGYVLHVGHLEPRKNVGVVVDALRLLPAAARPELWLAGRDAGALQGLRARAGDVGIRVLGVVTEPELASLYHHARAVVVPSAHEGFGLPALEGLAHGRPVLVAAAGALPEVVGLAGVCVPAPDATAWSTAIAATAAAGEAAPRRARAASFTWPSAAERQLAAWRHAAASS